MTSTKITVPCPWCGQPLLVPSGLGQLRVRCPCGHAFLWPSLRTTPAGSTRRRRTVKPVALAAGIILVLIAIFVVLRPRLPVFAPEQWVAVSSAALIDPSEITQSGETVGQMRGRVTQDSSAYAQLQPFVEPAAKLLPDALDMVRTP